MGVTPIKIIVKVINDSVRIRMLDELSGAIDRTASDFGILVTPFDLTQNRKTLQEVYKRSHIEVIDGTRLIDMLHKYRIAVRPSGEPDYAFIEELETRAEQVVEFFKHYARVR